MIVGQGRVLAKLLLEHLHLPTGTRSHLCTQICTGTALKFDTRISKCFKNRVIRYLNKLGYSEIGLLPGAVKRVVSIVDHS